MPRPVTIETYDAGSNWRRAWADDEYAPYEDALRSSAPALFGVRQNFLPFHLPYNDTWAPGNAFDREYGDTILNDGAGAAENEALAADGDYYYSWLGAGPDLSGLAPPIGQVPALIDPYVGYFGPYPADLQPSYNESPPWMADSSSYDEYQT